ncbi:MAG: YraN family protein [Cyanobacteria bacterium RUI128]|nr:YraN family protein [Cyanobacteria bacterium RUI128]
MSDNRKTGQIGEDMAAEYLIDKGYKILERNKHFSRACEVDIIALDKKTLVFVEVKTRSTNICGTPFEAITPAKYQKIKTGLFTYLSEHTEYKKYRIDGISVTLKPTVQIEHLENI